MRLLPLIALVAVLATACAAQPGNAVAASPTAPVPTPTPTAVPPTPTPVFFHITTASGDWTLTWSDEFDGPDGATVDPAHWSFDIGGRGWGNGELEYYTARTDNAYLDGNMLVIKAQRERYEGNAYTSARLKTQGKFSQAFGRFEARMKLPYGQGIWPAFWMLGDSLSTAGWPAAGEIDMMENIGKQPSTVHATVHGPGYSGADGITGEFTLPGGRRLSDDFHFFACEWEPQELRFYIDDRLYHTVTPADLPAGRKWVYDQPFFIILNLAVGGAWPGYPDSSTVFPQYLYVDYVRVYQGAP
jgi:beta-glucanase (GH16 family)